MKLNELLYKYESNLTLKVFLDSAMANPGLYATIEENADGYEIIPTKLFLSAMIATRSSITLDKDLNIKSMVCECLQFHKKNECIHIVALYAGGLLMLDRLKFDN